VSHLPIIKSIPYRDPVAAFAPFAAQDMAILLDSALPGAQARFSYIAIDPFRVIRCSPYPWVVTVDDAPREGEPFAVLAAALARFRCPPLEGPVPFLGGAVGFFSYELGGVLERLPAPKTRPYALDMAVGFYDTIVAFDHEAGQAWIIAHDFPQTSFVERADATTRATRLEHALGETLPPFKHVSGIWQADTTRAAQERRIADVIESINAGDIYQANMTQRFTAHVSDRIAPFDMYRHLRSATPAPFAAFINAGAGLHIFSASPERFLKSDSSGRVESRPIKGTRARGRDAMEDRALAAELLHSAKDRAENLMIVDLLRNDLARVCEAGSVNVPVLCGLETFSTVHHLVSVVTGQLRKNTGALDLLRAAFPGGSITGAPKIKAMEVIHAMEPAARGPYCGTVAWLGFDGAMDSSIVIRTLIRQDDALYAQAGGGIVAESDPAREYEESVTKIAPLLSVLKAPSVS
jgi:para-aminobenzoate synthetase component 1